MKSIHNIEISVFAREEEDNLDSVKEGILKLADMDLEKEKIKLEHTTATGAKDNKIDILKIRLEKERHVKKFVSNLLSNLTDEQKELILEQLDSRVDEECNFFIRLDKDKLLNDEYWITDSGNCFHIKMLVAAYPAKKDNAKEIIEKLFLS
jgi:RNA binding exosome subunit